MSKSSEIRNVAYDLLKANGNCTLEDIKKESANRGIELDPKSNAAGIVMGQLLKKDPNIKRTGRGIYEYIQADKTTDTDSMDTKKKADGKVCSNAAEIERLEKLVVEIIRKSRCYNLVAGNDEDREDTIECIKNIKHLYKTIEKEFAGN